MADNSKPNKKPIFPKFVRYIFNFLIFISLVFITTGLGAYYYFSKDLPKLDNIEDYHPPLVAEVFDAENNKVGEFWSECRFLTPIKDIPDKIVKALVATEDERFYQHKGVDPWGILRAFVANLKAGHTVQGGSTLTQQIAKALVLSPERKLKRKIQEAIVATKIESKFSKDQILFLYLNHTFFGNRAYGITAAARNYFHKDLKDLNLAEIAMLVGLPKAPSSFNPLVNPDRAKQRQLYVLSRMNELGYINKQAEEEAKKTPLTFYVADTDKEYNLQNGPYFVEQVRRYIQDKYGDDGLYKGGWKIYTTMNLDMQKAAENAVNRGVREVDKRHGFRGPIQSLADAQAIQKFNLDTHQKILQEEGRLEAAPKNPEAVLKQKTPLVENKYYRGVILEGSRTKGFVVQVGNEKGLITPDSMAWTYGGADRLKTGDVVEVKIYKKTSSPLTVAKKAKSSEENKSAITTSPTNDSSLLFSLEQEPNLQSALYSYEPFTGEVKAIVGGTDYRKSEFNRATQALRQPGSAIKPTIYAAALDKGYTPNTVIMDSPITYEESPGKFWTPKNYGGGYSGPTTLRNALVNSRNVVTVRIVMDVGTHYLDAYMRKLGITSPIQKYYSMALGSNDIYLADLARAYGTFVTGGILPDTHIIRKIVDPAGKVIEEHKPMEKKFVITWDETKQKTESAPGVAPKSTSSKGQEAPGQASIPETQASAETQAESSPTAENEQKSPESQGSDAMPWDEMGYNSQLIGPGEEVIKKDELNLSDYEKKILYGNYIPEDHVISPRTAATMVSLLQDVVKYGTGTRVLPLGKPAAGKTGTTNDSTDVWFMGFTPTLLAGVWVGNDEKLKSVGHGETGGHVSAPIWLYYMQEATKKYPTKDFKVPEWINLSQYQTPLEIVKGDMESPDYGGGGAGGGGGGQHSSGAEFFTNDL